MTRDTKAPVEEQLPEKGDETPEVVPYEAPVLVPLGNVHVLLAGHGITPTLDNNHIGMRN